MTFLPGRQRKGGPAPTGATSTPTRRGFGPSTRSMTCCCSSRTTSSWLSRVAGIADVMEDNGIELIRHPIPSCRCQPTRRVSPTLSAVERRIADGVAWWSHVWRTVARLGQGRPWIHPARRRPGRRCGRRPDAGRPPWNDRDLRAGAVREGIRRRNAMNDAGKCDVSSVWRLCADAADRLRLADGRDLRGGRARRDRASGAAWSPVRTRRIGARHVAETSSRRRAARRFGAPRIRLGVMGRQTVLRPIVARTRACRRPAGPHSAGCSTCG